MSNETFTVTEAIVLAPGGDLDLDGVIDPGETVRITVHITNNSTNPGATTATGLEFSQILDGMTLVDRPGADINVSPIAFNDSYTAVGNTLLEVGNATAQTGPQSSAAGHVTDNDLEFFGDSFTISSFQSTSANGGAVTMVTSGAEMGAFTYVSAAGFTGTDTFTYTVRDDGFDGIAGNSDDLVSTATVSINVTGQVWYVDGNAGGGGNGTSTNPFNTVNLAQAPSDSGDTIYVQNTAGGSITLGAGELLLGTGAELEIGGIDIAAAGANSTLNSNAAGFTVTLGSNNTIAGVDIDNTAGGALSGTGFGTVTVNNVALDASGTALSLATGAFAGSGFTSTDSDGGTNNVNLSAVTGTINFGAGALSGASGASFNVSGGTVSTDFNGTITQGNFANTVGASGGHTGTLTFDGNITSTGGEGLYFDNADGTYDFNGIYNANGGLAGVDILNGSGGTFTFDNASNVINHNAGGDAFTIGGTATTANVTWNGNITDNNGNAVNINEHDGGTVTFQNGTIASSGPSASGIDVANSNGGTINFNSQVTLSTQTNTAVNLTNNSGGTINFNPTGTGLDITTTTGTGFNATGGGTITVVDPAGVESNSIASGNGSALIVQNTTIGAADLTFQSIASSGGSANGIILVNTGNLGGLHVTGTGSAGSGGTIANKSGGDGGEASVGTGIYLSNTVDVQLNNVSLTTFTNYGIRGLQVDGFQLTNSTVNSAGSTAGESNISFGVLDSTNGLTGTATITNTTFNSSFTHGLQIYNTSGTLNLTATNIIANNNGDDGIQVRGFDSAVMNTEVKSSTFTSNHGDHFNATADNDADMNVLFGTNGGNTLVGTLVDNSLGNGITIQTGGQWTGTASANVSNNTVNFASDSPININAGGSGTVTATISNNIIGTSGVAQSGTRNGEDAIRLIQNGDKGALGASAHGGTLTALVSGNTIQQAYGQAGVHVLGRDGGSASDPIQINVTIQGNTFRESPYADSQAIVVESGASSTPFPDRVTVWADIGVTGAPNVFVGDWGSDLADINDINYVEMRVTHGIPGGNRFILTGYAGANNSNANVVAYLNANNDGESGAGSFASRNAANIWETAGAPPLPLTAAEFAPLEQRPYEVADQATQPGDGGDPAPVGDPGSGPDAPPPPADEQPAEDAPTPDASVIVDDGFVSQAELDFFVDAARQRWIATGLTSAQVAALDALDFQIAEITGLTLGSFDNGVVTIDSDGGGRGWYADATPLEDSEFANAVSATRLTAVSGTAAAGRFDLLTTVMHEMGHALGLSDLLDAASRDELLYGYLFAGERRLPGNEADGATPGSVTQEAFAGSLIEVVPDDGSSVGQDNIFNLPPGQSVDIQWDATVDGQTNQLIDNPQNSGTVEASNAVGFPDTPSNTVTTVLDSLTLGNLVYLDANRNGLFDGGDSGIDGVTLSLYVDADNNGVADGAAIATAITAGGGIYSFAGLAPGTYIVRADASNFSAPGVLTGLQVAGGAADPDNNINDDDNAGVIDVNGSSAAPITLAYNSEPSAGMGNDTNNTVDFAFFTNAAPVVDLNTGTAGVNDSNSFTEGGAAAGIGAAISVTDVGGDQIESATITITDAIAGDALTFSGPLPGGIVASGGGTATVTLTGVTSPANYAAALALVRYASSSDNPTAFGADTSRAITVVVNDGEVNSATATMTMAVVDTNDAPVLTVQNTAVSGTEDTDFVFGAGTSTAITVADVDDASLTVTLTVLNGTLTLSQTTGLSFVTGDGSDNDTMTFSGSVGNINTALEGLTYRGELNYDGSDTLSVSVGDGDDTDSEDIAISLADDGTIDGGTGDDVLNGTPLGDLFDLSQGGNDTATGLGSNDGFYMGAALSLLDNLDGGDGTDDQLGVQGNYGTSGTPFVLSATHLANIETLVLLSGADTRFGDTSNSVYDYYLKTIDGNVGALQKLTVNFNGLGPNEDVFFDGSAESDGWFFTYGGRGADTIIGGSQSDGFYFGNGGRWGSGDSVTGGGGADDQLGLQGSYAVTFGATQMSGIETLVLMSGGDTRFGNPAGVGYSYNLTMNDGNVADTATLTVNANTLRANVPGVTDEVLVFNGSAELDGHFSVMGGRADDTISGGALSDLIWGGLGRDTLAGNGGADTFRYTNVAQSRIGGFDQLIDFDDAVDKIDLPTAIASFASATTGALSQGTMAATLEGAHGSLGLGQAVVFTADGGDMDDRIFLLLNTNGTAGFQAASDFVIELVNPALNDNLGMFI